jgi:ABC-type branched-subunit amino acid transport system ATPase component
MPLLSVSNLSAGYGQIGVLRNVGFSVEPGEILGILGHNGMGKSTLLKTISGEISMTAGDVIFDGAGIGHLPSYRRAMLGIGHVPQGRQIFPNLTVVENMMMAALGTKRNPRIVGEMIEKFPRLITIADRKGGVLSGGEQQILALARCLCGAPKLILLDEPTEGVQPSIRDEIVETLLRLRAELDLTILLVEQNVRFMSALAGRILHMEKGSLGDAPLEHDRIAEHA